MALEDLFSVNRVDVVVISEVDAFLAANIIRADEYDLYILRKAGHLAPLERERISLIMEKEQ